MFSVSLDSVDSKPTSSDIDFKIAADKPEVVCLIGGHFRKRITWLWNPVWVWQHALSRRNRVAILPITGCISTSDWCLASVDGDNPQLRQIIEQCWSREKVHQTASFYLPPFRSYSGWDELGVISPPWPLKRQWKHHDRTQDKEQHRFWQIAMLPFARRPMSEGPVLIFVAGEFTQPSILSVCR